MRCQAFVTEIAVRAHSIYALKKSGSEIIQNLIQSWMRFILSCFFNPEWNFSNVIDLKPLLFAC